jgi:hypothetical protein
MSSDTENSKQSIQRRGQMIRDILLGKEEWPKPQGKYRFQIHDPFWQNFYAKIEVNKWRKELDEKQRLIEENAGKIQELHHRINEAEQRLIEAERS